jgi:maleate isomerase
MSLGFGDVARVGHLYPSGGLCDYEVQMMAPSGIQFVTTRLPFSRVGIEDDRNLFTAVEAHARLLADAEVSVIAANCTAATMLIDREDLGRRIRDVSGCETITTIESVTQALHSLGLSRIALVTPYPDEVVETERLHLGHDGFEVVEVRGIETTTPVEAGMIDPQRWVALCRTIESKHLDGVLISCAGIQIAESIETIESALNVPVVTSNQALLWRTLGWLGLDTTVEGYGELLRRGTYPDGGS